jgi:hypothetical protein
MKRKSLISHLIQLLLGIIVSSAMLYSVNEFNFQMACRYCCIGSLLLLLNRSRSVAEPDAHMLFLACCILFIVFKLASWQGTDIIEIVGFAIVSFLFLIQDTKKKESRLTSEIEENSHNKMLV